MASGGGKRVPIPLAASMGSPTAPIQSLSRSPSPGPVAARVRRRGTMGSEAGGSVYSNNTYNTHRTAVSCVSFQFSQASGHGGAWWCMVVHACTWIAIPRVVTYRQDTTFSLFLIVISCPLQMSRKTGMSASPATMKINGSLAGGGAAEKAAVIFRKHDQNQV